MASFVLFHCSNTDYVMSKCKCKLANSCGFTLLIHSFLPTTFSEGYERLAWARKGGTAIAAGNGTDKSYEMNLLSEGTDTGLASGHNTAAAGTSEPDVSTLDGGAEEFDMFAEDDEQPTTNKSSEEIDHIPHGDNVVPQPSLSVDNANPGSKLNLHELLELVEEVLLCFVFLLIQCLLLTLQLESHRVIMSMTSLLGTRFFPLFMSTLHLSICVRNPQTCTCTHLLVHW